MASAATPWTALVAHPSKPGEVTHSIDVSVRAGESGAVVFRYVLRAEMSRVRIPSLESAARTDGLWQHTCFEAFITAPQITGYYELNFSPSRRWAIYRFNGYRDGMSPVDVTVPPEIAIRCGDDRLELDATVHLPDLAGLHGAHNPRLALSVVVEEDSGTLSYWALRHPPGKPDFHHPDSFVLEQEI